MGSGKTTVATELGRRLELPVADTDTLVEERAGCTVADLFADRGEGAFRELEHRTLVEALDTHAGILALGGGAVLDPRSRHALRGHRVVLLQVDAAEALRRLPDDGSRPLLAEADPGAAWVAVARGRRPLYEAIATFAVDTTGRTPAEVADQILDRLDREHHD
ncbi:MAG: shikimate kinase [Austwickia sp.]|jgi:shikimate kinase|nr:shikimate kinase [Austwickia sp.]MBK8435659.1 shikimate kinase [Austwickia sp.]